jgi:PadR family transcriptional regulator, regulatory protein PadR
MTRENLGEFEQLVMLAIVHLTGKDDVYGVPIVDEIERRTRRSVARAAVYITLRRLEQKGLIESWMSDPTQERGGKSRRCVRVTKAGMLSLRDSRHAMEQMWSGLDARLEKIR